MPFRFALESVLHFRQSVEHQEELRLRAANQQVGRVRHMIEQIENRIKDMHARQSQELGAGTTAAELRFALSCEKGQLQQRQALLNELKRMEHLRDEQQKVFFRLRRERQTIEGLRDHQRQEYERNAARREQRAADDAFLLRQSFLQNTPAGLPPSSKYLSNSETDI
jgi:flagellar export protein FliJ